MDSTFYSKAPFMRSSAASWKIMFCFFLALLPTAVAGCVNYGMPAILLLLTTTGSAFAAELLICLIFRRASAAGDMSAFVTGLTIGLLLPPDLPLWQAAAGSAGAIIVVKQFCGGIGKYPVHPAAAAKLVLLFAFADTMSQFRIPMTDSPTTDIPLLTGSGTYWDLFLGNTAGSIGETCCAGILMGGIFLCLTGVISPAAPFGYLGSFALCAFLAGEDVIWSLLTGGVLFAAFFMATDYTTAPLTGFGKLLFGIGCGVITFGIRKYTGLPDSVCIAVIIMNLLTPLLDRCFRTKPFGAERITL